MKNYGDRGGRYPSKKAQKNTLENQNHNLLADAFWAL